LPVVVVAGGIVAPVLLLVGLARTGGLSGSLLLNLEAPLTALVAVTVFGEHLGRRTLVAGALVVGAATALVVAPGDLRVDVIGVVAIAAACGCWAIDNNLTASLTTRDPITLVAVKAGGAAAANLTIAAVRGVPIPTSGLLVAALAVGAVSYGLSVVLDSYALRTLGAAREAALFATAPFAGALLAIPLLGDTPTRVTWTALAGMAGGVILLLTERHVHPHQHTVLVHDHGHTHDDHHAHHHRRGVVTASHSHTHHHQPLVHAHPHTPDIHHRHPH
jgi:drug/metabolite transporter (DMT)-like permease